MSESCRVRGEKASLFSSFGCSLTLLEQREKGKNIASVQQKSYYQISENFRTEDFRGKRKEAFVREEFKRGGYTHLPSELPGLPGRQFPDHD